MKRIIKLMSVLLVACIALGAMSCKDDKEEPVNPATLPDQATTFISTYFSTANIVSAVSDKNKYEVLLSDGTRIDFDKDGNWKDVDAAAGKTVPTGFYPAAIDNYVIATAPQAGINEISKEVRGYDVELTTGVNWHFDLEGTFVGVDHD